MDIELRAPGLQLHRAQAATLAGWVRRAFAGAAHRIERVVLRITEAAGPGRSTTRDCVVEVHLPGGRTARVQERHRKLCVLVQRALHHARRSTEPLLPLPAPRLARRA